MPPIPAFGQDVEQKEAPDKALISNAAKQFRTEIGIRGQLNLNPLHEAKQAAIRRAAIEKARFEQQNARFRLTLRLTSDFTFRLVGLGVGPEPLETESQRIHLGKQLRNMVVMKTQERLNELEVICPLAKEQRQKLLLAAIADLKPIEREIANWEARYADVEAAVKVSRQAVLAVGDLNSLLAEQIGEKSLVPKVFLSVLTEEQARQLREACLLRFSDVAFAIGIPVEQRPELMEVFRKQTEALPLTLDSREFRVQVLDATPIEELARVVGPDYAMLIKRTPLLRK